MYPVATHTGRLQKHLTSPVNRTMLPQLFTMSYSQYKKQPLIIVKMYSLRGYSQGHIPAFGVYLCTLSEFEYLYHFVHNLKIKLYTYFIFTEVKYYIYIIFYITFSQI